jgi:hypothetical protein
MSDEKKEATKITPEKQESPKTEETVKAGGKSSKTIFIVIGVVGLLCICVAVILVLAYLAWFRTTPVITGLTPTPTITTATPEVTTTDVVKPKIGTAIQLTQLCKDPVTGVSMMLPEDWTCINDGSLDASSLVLEADSNGTDNLQFIVSNLGRDTYCNIDMDPGCTITPFYSSVKIDVNLFRDSGGGEILGIFNTLKTAGDSDYISVRYDNIQSQDMIPEAKQLLTSIIESVKTP